MEGLKIVVKMLTDNDAFDADSPQVEVARILRKLANQIERNGLQDGADFPLIDYNGLEVGFCDITDKAHNWSM